MGDKDGGDFGGALDFPNLLPGLEAQPSVQVGERLIQQQDVRHFYQRPGNGHPLLLAAGQLAGLAVQKLPDLYQRGCLIHTPGHLLFGKAVFPLQIFQREEDIFPHRQVGVEGVVLKHHAHPAQLWGQGGDVPVAEEDLSAGGLLQPADKVQGSALSTAGGAKQADELAVGNFKGEVIHSNHFAGGLPAGAVKGFCKMLKLNIHRRISLPIPFDYS